MSHDVQIKIFATQQQAHGELQKLKAQGFKEVMPIRQADTVNWINKAAGDASAVAFDSANVDGVWLFVVEH